MYTAARRPTAPRIGIRRLVAFTMIAHMLTPPPERARDTEQERTLDLQSRPGVFGHARGRAAHAGD